MRGEFPFEDFKQYLKRSDTVLNQQKVRKAIYMNALTHHVTTSNFSIDKYDKKTIQKELSRNPGKRTQDIPESKNTIR